MPELAHAREVAENLTHRRGPASELAVEVVEGLLLAIVAVMTAWSGYQSALWDSRSAASYAQASRLRVSAQGAQTLAGQQMLYDTTTFNAWLAATSSGNADLAGFLERRFRPEYRVAFQAWLSTDPMHNPSAPPGPSFMPEYRNANAEKAARLDQESTNATDAGDHARNVGDEYIRVTVLLAVVLFLTALSQRFQIRGVRIGILTVALLTLAVSVFALATIAG